MTDLAVIENNLATMCAEKAGAFPSDFNQTRFIQNALCVLKDVYGLEKVNKDSIVPVIMKGAFLDLDFLSKECYAIAYGGELNFQTDWKGEKKLVEKYSVRPIKTTYAKLIRKGDKFEEKIVNGEPLVNFEPLPLNNDIIVGVFGVIIYQDGGVEYEVMSKDQVLEIREKYAKKDKYGKFSPAWVKSEGEMYKKTILRRLWKGVPKSFVSIEQQKAFEDASEFDATKYNKKPAKQKARSSILDEEPIVDAEATVVPEEPETKMFACTNCFCDITENVSEYSTREFGKALCLKCQKIKKEKK